MKHQGKESSVHCTVPRFLQAEETMKLNETTDFQDFEGEETNEVEQFVNNSFSFCNQKKRSTVRYCQGRKIGVCIYV